MPNFSLKVQIFGPPANLESFTTPQMQSLDLITSVHLLIHNQKECLNV